MKIRINGGEPPLIEKKQELITPLTELQQFVGQCLAQIKFKAPAATVTIIMHIPNTTDGYMVISSDFKPDEIHSIIEHFKTTNPVGKTVSVKHKI